MTSSKLDQIGGFMKYWINSVIFFGYNAKGVECFYIVKGKKIREIPHSWELIQDSDLKTAWNAMKSYLGRNYSFAYDWKSEKIIDSGIFGV